MKIFLQRHHTLMVKDDLCHKIEYVTIFWDNLKCKWHPNCITNSKVTAIFLNGWILPICIGKGVRAACKAVFLLKVFFFFKIPDLAHRPIAAPVAGKNCC